MRGCILPLCPLSSGPAVGLSSIAHLRGNKDVGATLSLSLAVHLLKSLSQAVDTRLCWSFCDDSLTQALTCILASMLAFLCKAQKMVLSQKAILSWVSLLEMRIV